MLATAVAAYIVLLGAHARGLAGYWRTRAGARDARGPRGGGPPGRRAADRPAASRRSAPGAARSRPRAGRGDRDLPGLNPGSHADMAPRSIWNGTITFGLVNVPVKVYSATESKSIHFHQVHLDDGARIEHRARVPEGGQGGPQRRDRQGLRALQRRLRRADQGRDRGRRRRALEADRRRALRRRARRSTPPSTTRPTTSARATTARTPTGCCARRSRSPARSRSAAGSSTTASGSSPSARSTSILGLHTMNFHDEVVEPDDLDLPSPQKQPDRARDRDGGQARRSRWRRSSSRDKYEDTYREAVLEVIKRKAKGEEIERARGARAARTADDLMAALEASL